MPRLNDHGLGGGGKSIGVPVYPLNTTNVLQKDDVNGTPERFYGDTTATAPEQIYRHASCTIGDEMYFMGTYTNNLHCFKYNVKTKVWTQLTSTTYDGVKSWAVPHETDIYYGSEGYSLVLKYDTLTDTHSVLISDTGHKMSNSRATIDGDYIYIFGGNASSSYRTYATKVDIMNKTYTRLTSIPVAMYNHGCVNGGDGYIYLFGGESVPTSAYRYHIESNVYETLTNMPCSFASGSVVIIDNIIYLLNSVYSSPSTAMMYAYDFSLGSYTRLTDTLTVRYHGQAAIVDNVIYIIGGGTSSSTFTNGESMVILKVITLNVLIQKLLKGSKCYTDGDVASIMKSEFGSYTILEDMTTLEKINGAVTIPTDGEYALVGSNYATIGG